MFQSYPSIHISDDLPLVKYSIPFVNIYYLSKYTPCEVLTLKGNILTKETMANVDYRHGPRNLSL